MKQAIAYIRKSVVHKGQRTISWEVQEHEVRALAARYGDPDPIILSDWNRSGRSTRNRPGYDDVLDRIRSGSVSALYSYSLSRLNRSTRDYADLAELCVEQRVPVRLCHEGEQDFSTPSGRLIATILSAVAQMQSEIDSERASDVIRRRVANGERHGEAPYGSKPGEDPDAIVAAFRQAGSYHGAARRLNAGHMPTRRGKPWRATTVRAILHWYAPQVVPPGQVQRAKSAPPFRLARLLRCPTCGRFLTGIMQRGRPRYVCMNASDRNDHPGAKSISEHLILPWVITEAARLRTPDQVVVEATRNDERAALDGRLTNLSRQHEMGVISDTELRDRASAVQDALERLQSVDVVLDVPQAIEWDADTPMAVNAVLRALWRSVTLGPDLMPVEADWTVPQWRAA